MKNFPAGRQLFPPACALFPSDFPVFPALPQPGGMHSAKRMRAAPGRRPAQAQKNREAEKEKGCAGMKDDAHAAILHPGTPSRPLVLLPRRDLAEQPREVLARLHGARQDVAARMFVLHVPIAAALHDGLLAETGRL